MWELMEYESMEADVNYMVAATRLQIAQMRQMLHNPKVHIPEAKRKELMALIEKLETQIESVSNRHNQEPEGEEISPTVAGVGSLIILVIFAAIGLFAFVF